MPCVQIDKRALPPLWQLLALVAGTVFVVAALAVVPAPSTVADL